MLRSRTRSSESSLGSGLTFRESFASQHSRGKHDEEMDDEAVGNVDKRAGEQGRLMTFVVTAFLMSLCKSKLPVDDWRRLVRNLGCCLATVTVREDDCVLEERVDDVVVVEGALDSSLTVTRLLEH